MVILLSDQFASIYQLLTIAETFIQMFKEGRKTSKVIPASINKILNNGKSPLNSSNQMAKNCNPSEFGKISDKFMQQEDPWKEKLNKARMQRSNLTPDEERLWRKDQDAMLIYQMDKFLKFEHIKLDQVEEMGRWQESDIKGKKKTLYIKEVQKRNDLILNVIEQTRLEKLKNYEDRWPCLDGRKAIQKVRVYINLVAKTIINHKAFETCTITVILLNSITLATEKSGEQPEDFMILVDHIFLGLYTFEMCMKILGMGFIFGQNAYLRDFWGVLDFIIVSSAYFTLFTTVPPQGIVKTEGEGGANLNALRAFRVLRPLRTITSIKGLRVLVVSILSALPMLKQTVLVLFFFFLIFAIAGVQLLSGTLKNRCINVITGMVIINDDGEEAMCGGSDKCVGGLQMCGKANKNPSYGSTNYDNIFYALLMVFQCTTLEGWSDMQTLYQMTYSNYIYLYFVMMVFIGAFFLMNLTLAVINASFGESNSDQPNGTENQEGCDDEPNLDELEEELIKTEAEQTSAAIGIQEFFIAKRAAKKMIEFLRQRQQEKAVKDLEDKEIAKKVSEKQVMPITRESGDVILRLEGNETMRSNVPLMLEPTRQTFPPSEYFKQQRFSNTSMSQFEPHQASESSVNDDYKRGKVPTVKKRLTRTAPNFAVPLQKGLITQPQDHNDDITESNAENHKRDVKRFLAGLQSENTSEQGEIFSQARSSYPTLANQIPSKLMAGIQVGIRNHAWMKEEESLRPMKQMSHQGTQPFITPVGVAAAGCDRVTLINFSQDRYSEANSKLQDDLDFDKIITSKVQDDLVVQPRVMEAKKTESSGEHPFDMSFLESMREEPSALFDSEDLNGSRSIQKRAQQSKEVKTDSVVQSDISLQDQLEELKMEKEAEKQQAAQDKLEARLIDKEPVRREMLMSVHKKIRRFLTAELDNNDTYNGDQSQSSLNLAATLQKDNILAKHLDDSLNRTMGNADIAEEPVVATSLVQLTRQKKMQEQHDKKKSLDMNNIDANFLNMTQPKDPYEFIDKKKQKIEINPGIAFKSTSQDEVFEPRIFKNRARQLAAVNDYIQKPIDPQEIDSDPFDEEDFLLNKCSPYQMKTVYKTAKTEEFESDTTSEESEEDQPFETVMTIGYNHHLTHLPTRLVFRRSDILVSATLSLTLTPIERGSEKKNLVEMSEDEMDQWINMRCEFLSKNTLQQVIPEPGFVPAYYSHPLRQTLKQAVANKFQTSITPKLEGELDILESKLPSQSFPSIWSVKFDRDDCKMIPDCLLREPLEPDQANSLCPEEKKSYNKQKAKYEGHLRVQQNKGIQPQDIPISMEDARKLKEGNYWEVDDDELLDGQFEVAEDKVKKNKTQYLGRDENFQKTANLENFENALMKVINKNPTKHLCVIRNAGDEIPADIREELDLPKNLGKNQIDFDSVRIKDNNVKKKTPIWSGQDVLTDSLNDSKSAWILSFMNAVRVWPKGALGVVKKIQCILKIIVKSALFDNSMLSCVLLNTLVMASEAHGNTQEFNDMMEFMNSIFTWIFIVEMGIKLLAIGPRKYCMEAMNIIDGSVVLLSLVELSMSSGDGNQLSAFRTIRILRTLRVVRVVRILRALKSMAVIISVFRKSFSSFVYIAMLLMVCCFIFTLLGKTIFGAKFDYEPRPRGNFDTFPIAFITVFQILTMENWQTVAFDSMRSEMGQWVPALYYITWIFVGNFILLNLFLAILLDGFVEEDEQNGELTEEEFEKAEKIKQERRDRRMQERKEKLRRDTAIIFHSGNPIAAMGASRQHGKQYKSAMKGMVKVLELGVQDIIVDDIEDLDSEQIREIFLEQGILEDKTNKRKEAKMYEGVKCELSFYILSKQNRFRSFCYTTQSSKWFDNTIMALIALNSLKLGIDSYFLKLPEESMKIRVAKFIDYVFNIAFAIECFFKCIGLGLIMEEGSYLRDSWNQLDFFIVVTSLTDMLLSFLVTVDIGFFGILRLLRTLRPLRVISHNVAMKMIVSALFDSVGAILNVMVVVLCVWLMFAILAINLLSGKSFYCSMDEHKYHTKYECNVAGGSWNVYDSNYDNVAQAMMTLFIVSTLEGWPDIMLQSVDSTEVNKGPRMEASTQYIHFYIIFIFVGSFFLLNFFIGVLFLEYAKAQREESKGYTNAHINWISIQKMVQGAKVDHARQNMPDRMWRYKIWSLVNSDPFDILIMLFIVLNMIQMACDFEGAPPFVATSLRITNYIFTFVFFIEAVLKLLAYGWSYFQTAWNKFDSFVVAASLFDLGLEFVDAEDMKNLPIGNVAKVLRVLRVSRVLRLAKKSQDLQALVETITMSVSALLNVFGLLLLILFMFAVLGVYFFNDLTSGTIINGYKNFQTFGSAYLLLFAIATGEDWNLLMYDTMNTLPDCIKGETCGSKFAPVYFISFIMVITHVMLNLFILVIIQQFEIYYVAVDNPIKTFKLHFDMFHEVWVDHTQRFKCVKIKERQLVEFFQDLPAPQGLKSQENMLSDSETKKAILKMGIRSEDGWIYFNELLYRCMRRVYCNFKLNKKMQIIELRTLFKIARISLEAKMREVTYKINRQEIYDKIINKGQSVNPFLTMMYYRVSFNTWMNQAKRQYGDKMDYVMECDKDKVGNKVETKENQGGHVVMIEVEEVTDHTDEEEEDSPKDDVFRNKTASSLSLKKKRLFQKGRTLELSGAKQYSMLKSSEKQKKDDLGMKRRRSEQDKQKHDGSSLSRPTSSKLTGGSK